MLVRPGERVARSSSASMLDAARSAVLQLRSRMSIVANHATVGSATSGWARSWLTPRSVAARAVPEVHRQARCARRVEKTSSAWAQRAGCAQGTAPSALPGLAAMIGWFSHQPDAPTCQPQRGNPATPGRGEPPETVRRRRWPAVMTPRLAGLRADGVVASQGAADGAVPSIETARTHAAGTSRGAVARFARVQAAMPASSIDCFPASPIK
jgi:hypothetical protein